MELQHLKQSELQWMRAGANTYQVCGQTQEYLPPGAYTCDTDNCGNPIYHARSLHVDELIDFPDSLSSTILSEMDQFWTLGERFEKLGFLHRRGYLLYGKQGSGKSSLIHQLISRILSAGHVAFFCERSWEFTKCVRRFRQVEPDRPVVCVFEDIDALIENYGDSELLQWLDGNCQVDKAISIASTNYPEKLDPRIVARPRRFDRILRIDAPEARLREAYFARKLPELNAAELQEWVDLSDGLSFAALAEMVISVYGFGNSLEETAQRLQALDTLNPTSDEFYNFCENPALVHSESESL